MVMKAIAVIAFYIVALLTANDAVIVGACAIVPFGMRWAR